MNGLYLPIDFDNVLFSTARSMARFGLLMLAKGKWDGLTVLNDSSYFEQMINTSQNLNLSYGFLWWLNGKTSFMVPQSQLIIPFPIFADAPNDMYAALGKNGQILNVIPSQKLIVVRMGDMPNTGEVPFTLNNEIWKRLNTILNSNQVFPLINLKKSQYFFPNPAKDRFYVNITEKNQM